MSRDDSECLMELLAQPVIQWGEVSLQEVPREKKEQVLAAIVSKNPPKGIYEPLLREWIKQEKERYFHGGWSMPLYKELVKPEVNIDIMKAYFDMLLEEDINLVDDDEPFTFSYLAVTPFTTMCPAKMQCLFTFLISTNRSEWAVAFLGRDRIFDSSPSGLHDSEESRIVPQEESWVVLQAIVRTTNQPLGESETLPFLEQYLNTVLWAVEEWRYLVPRFGESIDKCVHWRQHLKLVAKFAPRFFTVQSSSTGNTFLNHLLKLSKRVLYPELTSFIRMVTEQCFEALYIPNMEGQTPLDHMLSNMLFRFIDRHQCPRWAVDDEYVSLCAYIVAKNPSAVIPCAAASVGANAEPFFIFVSRLVDTFAHITEIEFKTMQRVASMANTFNDRVTDNCCHNLFDQDGNTALHTVIEMWSGRTDHEGRARKLLLRVMTRQAALTRNKGGQLPIDVALEANNEPWVSVALSEVAPKALEYRNAVSKLYPFQAMALQVNSAPEWDNYYDDDEYDADAVADADDAARISACYSLLRVVPHLVSTGLTEANTKFLLGEKLIEASRLHLDIEREWMAGKRKAKDLHQMAIDLAAQSESRKRKRLQDVKRLVEENLQPEAPSSLMLL